MPLGRDDLRLLLSNVLDLNYKVLLIIEVKRVGYRKNIVYLLINHSSSLKFHLTKSYILNSSPKYAQSALNLVSHGLGYDLLNSHSSHKMS